MLKVSSRTRLAVNISMKIIIAMLVASSLMFALLLASYKPVYKVSLGDEELGYATSKSKIQDNVADYLQNGDSENVGYVLMEEKPTYSLKLAKKDIKTEDEVILAKLKDSCDVFYRVYAVEVNGEQVCLADNMDLAQTVVDEVMKKQEKYTKQATVRVAEKYEQEYEAIAEADVEVTVASIIKPIKAENDAVVRKNNTYAAAKTVSQEVLTSLLESTKELNFSKPVNGGVITSRYGWRRNGTEYHTGLDYGIGMGTPIYAAEDGVVTCAQWSGNYGYLVKIQHAGNYETRYAHCSKFAVSVGTEVKKGDVIAYVGSTGRSTGPHVHLEIRYEGKHLNPEDFL
ncbi:MAG: M23 family metallopeptidase [Clostridia bacterium]|nr:M23 family metallopeptidase [Clostridia bacterium]